MNATKSLVEMNDTEIVENYRLFNTEPSITPEEKIQHVDECLFHYKKCSILKDSGIQYSNHACASQEG